MCMRPKAPQVVQQVAPPPPPAPVLPPPPPPTNPVALGIPKDTGPRGARGLRGSFRGGLALRRTV